MTEYCDEHQYKYDDKCPYCEFEDSKFAPKELTSGGQCRSDDISFEELQDHVADAALETFGMTRQVQNWNEDSGFYHFTKRLYESLKED